MPGLANFNEVVPFLTGVSVQASDGTTVVDMFPTIVQVARIDTILVSNSDAIDHAVAIYATVGSLQLKLGSALIPAGTGGGALPSADWIAMGMPLLAGGLVLPIGYKLQILVAVAMGSGTFLTFVPLGGFIF